MFLGRSTVQWMAVVTAGINIAGLVFPGVQPAVWQGLSVLAAAIIALVASQGTTPSASPQLKVGTQVTVTDQAGKALGTTPVIDPTVKDAPQP